MKILRLIGVALLAVAMLVAVTLVTASGIDPPIFTYLAPRNEERLRIGGRPGAADEDVARQRGPARRSWKGLRNWFLSHDSFGRRNAWYRRTVVKRCGPGVLARAASAAA